MCNARRREVKYFWFAETYILEAEILNAFRVTPSWLTHIGAKISECRSD